MILVGRDSLCQSSARMKRRGMKRAAKTSRVYTLERPGDGLWRFVIHVQRDRRRQGTEIDCRPQQGPKMFLTKALAAELSTRVRTVLKRTDTTMVSSRGDRKEKTWPVNETGKTVWVRTTMFFTHLSRTLSNPGKLAGGLVQCRSCAQQQPVELRHRYHSDQARGRPMPNSLREI